MHFAAGNPQAEAANDLLVANGDTQVFYSQFLHKAGPEIYSLSDDLRTAPGHFRTGVICLCSALKESAEERRRFIRDADDFVRCLTIKFEIELGFRATVIPVGKRFKLIPSQAPLRHRGASDGDAHARRLSGDPGLLCDCFGRGDNAARYEARSAFIFACEDKDSIAFGDVLAVIHRLLPAEREHPYPQIADLGFDRERHISSICEFGRPKTMRNSAFTSSGLVTKL